MVVKKRERSTPGVYYKKTWQDCNISVLCCDSFSRGKIGADLINLIVVVQSGIKNLQWGIHVDIVSTK